MGRTQLLDPMVAASTRHGRMTAMVSKLCEASAAFARHCLNAPPSWFHLVYAAADLRAEAVLSNPLAWGDALALTRAAALIPRVFDVPVIGMARALTKFAPQPLRPGGYSNLKTCLMHPVARKLIYHARALDADMLEVVLALPPQALSANLMACCDRAEAVEAVTYCVDALKSVLNEDNQTDAWRGLRTLSDIDRLLKWFFERLLDAPFPPAPWQGSERLTPIADGRQLRDVGRAFGNCLESYVVRILAGGTVIYRWAGSYPVVIALKREAFFGWVVGEMRGKGDNMPPAALVADIMEHFAAAGFRRDPFPILDMVRW